MISPNSTRNPSTRWPSTSRPLGLGPRRRVAAGLVAAAVAVIAWAPSPSAAKNAFVLGSDDAGLQWALMGPGDQMSSSTWNDDARRIVEKLRRRDRELLWLRLADRDYVVIEPSALDDARAAFHDVIELGSQQGRLGRVQGELGRKQGRLGREQARIGALQGRLGVRLARTYDDAEGRRARAEVQRQMEELSAMQQELAEAQRPLAQRQQELGQRQQALGERQREASAEAARTLNRLATKWIADGTAKRYED